MNRRLFLSSLLGVLVGGIIFKVKNAKAQDAITCPPPAPEGVKLLKVDDVAAKRLDYVEDHTKTTHKKYVAGDDCTQCKYYIKDKEKGGYAPCKLLSQKYVPGCGWCKSFKKPS